MKWAGTFDGPKMSFHTVSRVSCRTFEHRTSMKRPIAKRGVPDKKKSPKAYKRYLRRLKEIDSLLTRGRIRSSGSSSYSVKSVVSGGLPSLGKR